MSKFALILMICFGLWFTTAEAQEVEYEYLFQWGQAGLPEENLSRPTGVTIGPAGQVYVVDPTKNALKIYTASGEFVDSFPITGCNTMAVEVDPAGRIIVLEREYNCAAVAYVYESDGDLIGSFGAQGYYFNRNPGYFWNPEDLAIDPNSLLNGPNSYDIHIIDPYNDRIQVFGVEFFPDDDGDEIEELTAGLVGIWGSFGSGPGQFDTPGGIEFDASGVVYVSEQGGHRIQVFDPTGTYPPATWGHLDPSNPPLTDDGLLNPRHVAIGPDGHLFVVDAFHHRIVVFDSSGSAVETVGSLGSGDGQFFYPISAAVSPSGLLYVTDPNHGRIQVFGPVAEATPSELIVELVTTISLGDFPNAVEKAGTRKLELAERFIQRGKINSAINQLFVFQEIVQNQIDDGKLDPIDGYELIAAAQQIIEAITTGT